jgi:hypothetical protein
VPQASPGAGSSAASSSTRAGRTSETTPPPAATSAPPPIRVVIREAPAPAAPATPPAATHHTPRLAIAVEHVHALLRIASHRGQAHAHLALKPAELGGVEVRLRVTTHGLVASITAERPESAQVLQQAGADLRRAFEAAGVDVASLDIGFAGEDAGNRAHERDAEAGAPAARAGATNGAADDELQPTDPTTPTTNTTTIALGALVDVLA